MKSKKMSVIFVSLLLIMLLAACSTAVQGGDELDGSEWQLSAWRKSRPSDGVVITAAFQDGRVSGSAGCNHYSAEYSLEGDSIDVGAVEITEMACLEPQGVMEDEQTYIGYLMDAVRYEIDGDRLYIYWDAREMLTYDRQG